MKYHLLGHRIHGPLNNKHDVQDDILCIYIVDRTLDGA